MKHFCAYLTIDTHTCSSGVGGVRSVKRITFSVLFWLWMAQLMLLAMDGAVNGSGYGWRS
jgi:hypothetical protein